MDAKILIIAVVAIVAIGGGVAAFLMLGNGSDSNDSDYTLLDSNDNIKKGLTIELTGKYSGGSMESKYVVDSVSGGKVGYSEKAVAKNVPAGSTITLANFYPDKFSFDYTDESDIPEGVEVKHDGDTYKITGEQKDTSYGERTVVFDLSIKYADDEVTAVNGSMEMIQKDGSSIYEMKYKFEMSGDKLKVTGDTKQEDTDECDVDDYYSRAMTDFDMDDYKGAQVTSKDGKYGGVDVKIYTVNGTVDNYEYKDVKIYVYKDYVLKQEGKIVMGDETYDATMTTKVYQA